MSTPLTALNPFVLPSAGGVASSVALHHIRQACIEFCKRSLVWRVRLPDVKAILAPISFTAPLVNALSGTLTAPFAGPTRTDYLLTFADSSQQVVTLVNGSTFVGWLNAVTAAQGATYAQTAYPFPSVTDGEVAKFLKFIVCNIKRRVVTPDLAEDMVLYRFQQQYSDDIAWTTDRASFNVSPPPFSTNVFYGTLVAMQPTQTAATIPDDVFANYAEAIAAGAIARIVGLPKEDWTDMTLAKAKRDYFEEQIGKAAMQAAKGFSRGRRRARMHAF